MNNTDKLLEIASGMNTIEVIEYFLERFKNKIALATSYSIEDQVITHLIASIDKDARIFTLDTGRLPAETYKLIESTNEHFGINVEVFFPDYRQVENMVHEKGINLFYNSIENRKLCCNVRKIEPLKRAMEELEVWITGLRREQSVTRDETKLVEYDSNFSIIKLNPLVNWTEEDVWNFIKHNNIPYNSLYNKNYRSIGCAPCTRSVKDGGSIRDGRWWWENPDTKECGLHFKTNRE
jgi:phosphoadenosine phosphosulfate reductase